MRKISVLCGFPRNPATPASRAAWKASCLSSISFCLLGCRQFACPSICGKVLRQPACQARESHIQVKREAIASKWNLVLMLVLRQSLAWNILHLIGTERFYVKLLINLLLNRPLFLKMWELQLCGQVLDKAEKSSAAQVFHCGEDSMDSTWQAAKI